MSRQSNKPNKRAELLPKIAEAFGELGYRRATTAAIAARCEVQETTLYRLWDDKKAMFLAVIDYLVRWRANRIRSVMENVPEDEDHLEYLIEDVSSTLGEHGLQRVLYAALGELGDPDIRNALQEMYRQNYAVVLELVGESDAATGPPPPALEKDAVWAIMGLVTMMDLSSELELLGPRQRKQVFGRTARALLGLPEN